MVKRKLVKQGAATLMISIPSKWAKKFNLDKGDELDVEEKGNSLVLGVEPQKIKKAVEISLSSLQKSSIRTVITNAYRLGYDKIRLNFDDKSALVIITDIVQRNLLGFEIIKKTDKSCEIENVTEPSPEQFDNIFSKEIMNIEELFDTVEKAMKGEKPEFEDLERNILRYDAFCRRVITKTGMENAQMRWSFHSQLIHAQRNLYFIFHHLKKPVNKKVLELLSACRDIFLNIKEAYEKRDIPLVEKTHDLVKIAWAKSEKLTPKQIEPSMLVNLMGAVRGFYLCNSPLMGVFMAEKS
jgi:phosphate uptake regulator